MENIIYLHGTDYTADMALIDSSISRDPVFLFDEPHTELYQYIDYLHEECGLKSKVLNKLRVCREIVFAGNVTLVSGEGAELGRPGSMGALLERLQPGERFRLVIENNSRPLLANIVQQLIYINYPLTEVDMKLRSEYKDAAKTALFMEHIQTLQTAAKSAVDKLSELEIDPDAPEETREKLYRNRAEALASYQKICEQIEKARDVEMKVAVAASKKTGKSVIVNCMLGVELAPTSLELATPNTCVYSRSPDKRFHLQMVQEDGTLSPAEDFDGAEQLHKRLSRAFKQAQDDAKAGFAAPDMRIAYVSNGNNFESYTVYDTPGPDLAGSHHAASAKRAVEECDVAIFAIDYTKYLTKDEESFLREIKTTFQEKHKFHTLIFVINKMDEALSDKGTKSRVKSIDFIRSRLRAIDPQYGDCIVFATSAQDYFCTLELEEAAGRLEELTCLRDPAADLYQHLRPVQDALAENGHDDENLTRLLSNLDGEVGRIKRQLGYPAVDIGTLRHYSGVPQLMDYVSYIAKSKARDEIVNSITHTIAAQCSTLRALISQIANMEELMGKTQQEIDQISAILDGYVREVRGILNGDLTEEDLRCLDPQKLLAAQIAAVQQQSGALPAELPKVLREMRRDITHLRESRMEKELWEDFLPLYQEKIKRLVGRTVLREELDVTEKEVRQVIEGYLLREVAPRIDDEIAHVNDLAKDLTSVIVGRMDRVAACTERCQQRLAKNDCHLQLPEPAAFEAAIPTLDIQGRITVRRMGMSGKLHGVYRNVSGIERFFRNIFVHGDIHYDKKEVQVKHRLTEEEAERLYRPFCKMLEDAQIYPSIRQILKEVGQGVGRAEDEVLRCFQEMNDSCAGTVEAFKRGIDDRGYYEEQLAEYGRIKALTAQIEDASKDFLDTWALVLAE